VAGLRNIHPGEVLVGEFLKSMGISVHRPAKETGIAQTRVSQRAEGKRRGSADTALRLSRCFGTTAQLSLGLQDDCDLEEEQARIGADLEETRLVSSS
jgi:addiction module HigA family antidote